MRRKKKKIGRKERRERTRKEKRDSIALRGVSRGPPGQETRGGLDNGKGAEQCVGDICTPGRWRMVLYSTLHSGPEQPKIQTEILGHPLVRSLVCSHHSLVHLLQTARFAGALHCTHLFACSLISLTPSLMGK